MILPRSRKIGRILPKAFVRTNANTIRNASVIPVINALILIRNTSAIKAVIRPPTKSTRPVPIRLRTPSTSLMMRETSAPLLFAS